MFERRLKIFLSILVLVTAVLVLRAAHVQVWQKAEWQAKAEELKKRSRPIETVRGSILDVTGKPIALDRPCVDACVDYRALTSPPDPKWVESVAAQRVKARLRGEKLPRAEMLKLTKDESQRVVSDIDRMWDRLAKLSGRLREDIEATRDDVVKKIRMRKRYVIYRNYQIALKKHEQREPAPAWRSWLIDASADAPVEDDFADLTLDEEDDAHVILKAVDAEVQNALAKRIEEYPGLKLRPGVERHYPFGDAACHILGQLSKVTREDLEADPNVGTDELRQYLPNDLVGRTGLEKLAEPLLRGSRGKIVTIEGRGGEVGRVESVPGRDVRTTIDIHLQADLINMFKFCKVVNWSPPEQKPKPPPEVVEMHGGAVVIDVPTGHVLAMASYPTFDLNTFADEYPKLADDDLNRPLINRATQMALNPGSTVKPVVGLGAIADGHITVHQGIECTGFLVIGGTKIPKGGRCWTESMFGSLGLGMHHQTPSIDPHIGHHGNPTGFLDYGDAVQRSCNVYFETMGHRMRMEGMARWFNRFGIGRRTGIGLTESRGSDPSDWKGNEDERRFATWIAAIGQGSTTATPLQMANVSATIARDGVWVRPRLFAESEGVPKPRLAPGEEPPGPDVVNLGLPRDAIRAAQEGMTRVVNTEAGSGKLIRRPDVVIAGKTGTAETASPVEVMVRRADGSIVYEGDPDEDAPRPTAPATTQPQTRKRKPKERVLEPTSPQHRGEAPWFRGFGQDGKSLKHSWFIGFAPADKPKIAFAIAVEYGGSGGGAAGYMAKDLMNVLIERGYVPRDTKALELARPAAYPEPTEPHTVGDESDDDTPATTAPRG